LYGGSGAGKSASYVIPNALQLLGSYVFTDPKGELYDKTAGYFKEKGYEVKVLNLVNPENSDGYNPLAHIKSEIDVDIIANTIMKGQSEGNQSDPYWDNMAEMLLKSLIYFLKAVRPPEEQNLASCSEMVRAANTSGGGNKLTELISILPDNHPARTNYKSIEIAPEKTYSSILSTLQSKLGKFDSKLIAEVTSTNTIDFEEIGAKKTVVYVISSDTHTAYNFLLTIFFSQMIQQLYDFADKNGGALPIPTYFILDEFANIGQIPDFDKKISTSRSRKISFSVILQNLDQLEAVYEKANETIIGNCDTHLFLGSNSQKTVEYFSKQLGEKTITRNNYSINRDKGEWKSGSSESDQIMARALMTPDELRRMDNDLCIIFEKGIKPIKANKYYYFKYPEGKIVDRYKADHNDVMIERGPWRIFNPNNPYEESNGENESFPSLDSLFEDDSTAGTVTSAPKTGDNIDNSTSVFDSLPGLGEPASVASKVTQPAPQTESKPKATTDIDIQKELEAKFDELFGALDDEDE
jgi:type IV secretion system protein VirD4